jgi:hypothetical protein
MTLQPISGSDVYGHVHWSQSINAGTTWSDPAPIPGLGRKPPADGLEEGVCDVVPDYHAKTETILAIGHNVFYKNNKLATPQPPRHPVYSVRDTVGDWSVPKVLKWDDPRGSAIYTCGCGQRVTLENGDILIPFSFGPKDRVDRSVAAFRCSFDGKDVSIKEIGNELRRPVKRGLLEPSMTLLDGRYYMTIRAEDDRGYVTQSNDGLHWPEPQPWCWDDGTPLTMSTTQQHWLTHSDALYLVYTRMAETNAKVFRWRAPLFIALVDRSTMRLVRQTERIVLPILGDPLKAPAQVARMGNFHVVNVSPDESLVTDVELSPQNYTGDLMLARIRWARPNRL